MKWALIWIASIAIIGAGMIWLINIGSEMEANECAAVCGKPCTQVKVGETTTYMQSGNVSFPITTSNYDWLCL